MHVLHPNQKAFLDMLAFSEGTHKTGQKTYDRGYDVMVGGQLLMVHYKYHPGAVVRSVNSSAAGRYQILQKTYNDYAKILGLKDFSPEAQDAIALRLIKDCGAEEDVKAGRVAIAIEKCKRIWASLPGAGYGQRENAMTALKQAYALAGGRLAVV